MLEITITVVGLSFVIGGCSMLIVILFLMGASPDTTQKRADDSRERMNRPKEKKYQPKDRPKSWCDFDE